VKDEKVKIFLTNISATNIIYIAYDDYGLIPEEKMAIDNNINCGRLEIVAVVQQQLHQSKIEYMDLP